MDLYFGLVSHMLFSCITIRSEPIKPLRNHRAQSFITYLTCEYSMAMDARVINHIYL